MNLQQKQRRSYWHKSQLFFIAIVILFSPSLGQAGTASYTYESPNSGVASSEVSLGYCSGAQFKKCNYNLNQIESNCSVKQSSWKFRETKNALWLNGNDYIDYATSSGLAKLAWTQCGLQFNQVLVQTSATAASLVVGQNYCPSAQAISEVSCEPIPPPCTKKPWYLDADCDGVGSSSSTPIMACDADKPAKNSNGCYVSVTGDQCDNDPKVTQKIQACVDADNDSLTSSNRASVSVCPTTSGFNPFPSGYTSCYNEGKLGGLDCNDNDSTIQDGDYWSKDSDGDGYTDPSQSFIRYCQGPIGYIKSSTAKGVDQCDNNPKLQKGTSFCMDVDGDGYGDPLKCDRHCEDNPKPPTNTMLKYTTVDKLDCNGGDNDATINPLTEWVIDCDGDTLYDKKYLVKGCQKPAVPDYCAAIENPPKTAQTTYIPRGTTAGKKLLSGDCDDADTLVHEIQFLFADKDFDGQGDPKISKMVYCNEPETTTDTDTGLSIQPNSRTNAISKGKTTYITNPNSGKTILGSGTFDKFQSLLPEWVSKPNDLNPKKWNKDVAATMDDTADFKTKLFFITDTKPATCIDQAANLSAPYCQIPGDFCAYSNGSLTCISNEFRSAYCPSFGSTSNNLPWYMLDDKFPYDTSYPIVEAKDWQGIESKLVNYKLPDFLLYCMIQHKPDDGFVTFLEVKETGEQYLVYRNLSNKFQPYVLIEASGNDYEIDTSQLLDLVSKDRRWKEAKWLSYKYDLANTVVMTAAHLANYMGQFSVYSNLAELQSLPNLPYPLPIHKLNKFKGIAPELYCVINNSVLKISDCSPATILGLIHNQITSDILPATAKPGDDTDGDGYSDAVEARLANVSGHNPIEAVFNPNVKPVLESDHLVHINLPLSPKEFAIWEQARLRAHNLLADVYATTYEVAGDVDELKLLLFDIDDWHKILDKIQPSVISFFNEDDPALTVSALSWLKLPIGAPYSNVAGLNICRSKNPNKADPYEDCIYVNVISIAEKNPVENDAVNYAANAMIHEVLHSVIVPSDQTDKAAWELAHAFIYALTNQYVDYGDCGLDS